MGGEEGEGLLREKSRGPGRVDGGRGGAEAQGEWEGGREGRNQRPRLKSVVLQHPVRRLVLCALLHPRLRLIAPPLTPPSLTQVLVSLAACAAFVAIGFPTIVHFAGWFGLVKYWLMPWLGYHFWMSTFTVIHHTAPHIPFKPADEWNAAKAQLTGTVHCNFPSW